jgi:hypothetical protein
VVVVVFAASLLLLVSLQLTRKTLCFHPFYSAAALANQITSLLLLASLQLTRKPLCFRPFYSAAGMFALSNQIAFVACLTATNPTNPLFSSLLFCCRWLLLQPCCASSPDSARLRISQGCRAYWCLSSGMGSRPGFCFLSPGIWGVSGHFSNWQDRFGVPLAVR